MIKYNFLSAMKLSVFCSVLSIYFASPTAAQRCYVMNGKVCCQGDLCNGSDKLSNQMNVLLCAVFLVVFTV